MKFYEKNPEFVVPKHRFKEIVNFVKGGLKDFSISRLKSKMPWGVDVPGDPDQVMYVWFDALVSYISATGWPDKKDFDGYWPGVQMAGKDNLRQQTAIWQAMLMSAGLPNSKQVLIHGFITSEGQKMSKSLGNVVNPITLSKKYGAEALRYYLLAKIHPFNDSDFTTEDFEKVYNADLANGLGNLTSRIEALCKKYKLNLKNIEKVDKKSSAKPFIEINDYIEKYQFHEALRYIWSWIHLIDKWIDREKPWKWNKNSSEIKKLGEIIEGTDAVVSIKNIAKALRPFLPETADKIFKRFDVEIIKEVGKPLFPRL